MSDTCHFLSGNQTLCGLKMNRMERLASSVWADVDCRNCLNARDAALYSARREDARVVGIPTFVRLALRVLLNHVEPGWENCKATVQAWLDDEAPAAAPEPEGAPECQHEWEWPTALCGGQWCRKCGLARLEEQEGAPTFPTTPEAVARAEGEPCPLCGHVDAPAIHQQDQRATAMTGATSEGATPPSASPAMEGQDVREAAQRLVAKLDIVHDDPAYQSVWTLHQVHGGQYSGPQYAEELEALRLALAGVASAMGMQDVCPGPWWVDDRRASGGALQIMGRHRGPGSSYCIASVNFHEDPEAHAALIVAAVNEKLAASRTGIEYTPEGYIVKRPQPPGPVSATNPLTPGCYCKPGKCSAPKPEWCRDTVKRDASPSVVPCQPLRCKDCGGDFKPEFPDECPKVCPRCAEAQRGEPL
jgi:hypothetical protein